MADTEEDMLTKIEARMQEPTSAWHGLEAEEIDALINNKPVVAESKQPSLLKLLGLGILTIALLVGCGSATVSGSGTPSAAAPNNQATTATSAPATVKLKKTAPTCTSLLTNPNWAAQLEATGCTIDGAKQIDLFFTCKDGSILYFWGDDVNHQYWGNTKGKLTLEPPGQRSELDPAYKSAYNTCGGIS